MESIQLRLIQIDELRYLRSQVIMEIQFHIQKNQLKHDMSLYDGSLNLQRL